MAHPGAGAGGGNNFSQTARLAWLGLGTIATGALGVIGLAAGYQVKVNNKPHKH